jgi:FAD-linked sulfhydryl oxidase
VSRAKQLILTTLALLHPPSRAYLDPWTGELFGEGGVEKDVQRVPAKGVSGGVIMSKLGNETAKYVLRFIHLMISHSG